MISGADVALYMDGEPLTLTWRLGGPILAGNQPLRIGGIGNDDYLDGWLDEVRLEHTARSADWVRFCHENQKPGSSLATIEYR